MNNEIKQCPKCKNPMSKDNSKVTKQLIEEKIIVNKNKYFCKICGWRTPTLMEGKNKWN